MTYQYVDPWQQAQQQVQPPAGPFPVPGFRIYRRPPGGPLAGMQDSIAGVLNAADQDHVYIPTGEANPIIPVPRRFPAAMYRQGYGPAGQPVRLGGRAKLFLLGWVLTVLASIGLNMADPALDPGRDLGIAAFLAGPVVGFVLALAARIRRRRPRRVVLRLPAGEQDRPEQPGRPSLGHRARRCQRARRGRRPAASRAAAA